MYKKIVFLCLMVAVANCYPSPSLLNGGGIRKPIGLGGLRRGISGAVIGAGIANLANIGLNRLANLGGGRLTNGLGGLRGGLGTRLITGGVAPVNGNYVGVNQIGGVGITNGGYGYGK